MCTPYPRHSSSEHRFQCTLRYSTVYLENVVRPQPVSLRSLLTYLMLFLLFFAETVLCAGQATLEPMTFLP